MLKILKTRIFFCFGYVEALSEDEPIKLKSQLKDVNDDFDLVYKNRFNREYSCRLKAIDELYQPELIIFAPPFPI